MWLQQKSKKKKRLDGKGQRQKQGAKVEDFAKEGDLATWWH